MDELPLAPLKAEGAAQSLKGLSFADAFIRYVIRDPMIQELGVELNKRDRWFERTLEDGA